MLSDNCCSIAPYFDVPPAEMDAFREIVDRFVEASRKEDGCLYYGFSFNGNIAHCREGYAGADALLAHLDNVGELLAEAQQIATIARLEIHGPEAELAALREPLSSLNVEFYTLEAGFRN